jgi:hypothetical protein
LIFTTGFLIGIIMGLYINIIVVLFLFAMGVFLYFKLKKTVVIIVVTACVISYFYVIHINKISEEVYENAGNTVITGIIISDKQEKPYTDMYTIEIKTIGSKKYSGVKCLIYIKKGTGKVLEYGDYVKTEGELEIPDARRNFGRI